MMISNRYSELELHLDGCENKWNISVSRFTLKESADKVTSKLQSALLPVLIGRQCIWMSVFGFHKTQKKS